MLDFEYDSELSLQYASRFPTVANCTANVQGCVAVSKKVKPFVNPDMSPDLSQNPSNYCFLSQNLPLRKFHETSPITDILLRDKSTKRQKRILIGGEVDENSKTRITRYNCQVPRICVRENVDCFSHFALLLD